MKIIQRLAAVSVLAYLSSGCGPKSPEQQYVRQKIPIQVRRGEPITVEISLSGNGPNDVGIQCTSEIWSALTNGTESITVRLKSSSKKNTEVYAVNPGGSAAGFLYLVPNGHYLFEIIGEYNAKASVEITFPNAPRA